MYRIIKLHCNHKGTIMDANKLEKLREVNYKLQKSCLLCTYSMFSSESNWGECKKFNYKHQNRSGKKRQLSIHKGGVCDSFAIDRTTAQLLRYYTEFEEWL